MSLEWIQIQYLKQATGIHPKVLYKPHSCGCGHCIMYIEKHKLAAVRKLPVCSKFLSYLLPNESFVNSYREPRSVRFRRLRPFAGLHKGYV